MTPDGGGAEDYILYVGQGAGVPPESNDAPSGTLDPLAIGFPNGEDNNLDAFFQTLFPSPPYPVAGSPGEAWLEIEILYLNDVLVWKINGTTILNHDVLSFSSNTSGSPMLGYMDIFASVNGTPADQFGLIDNLLVEEIIITSVGDFELYD